MIMEMNGWKSVTELNPMQYGGPFVLKDDIGTEYIFTTRRSDGKRPFYFNFEGRTCRSTRPTGVLKIGERITEIYNGMEVPATVTVTGILIPSD